MSFVGHVQQSSKFTKKIFTCRCRKLSRRIGVVVVPGIRTLRLLQHSFRLCRPSKQSDRWMRGTLAWQFFYKHAYCRSLQAFDNNERKVPKQKKASSLWKGWKCQFPSSRFFNRISARHMDPTLQQTEPQNGATYRQLDFTSKSYSKYPVAQHNQ